MGFCRVRGGRDTDFMAAVVRAYRDRRTHNTTAVIQCVLRPPHPYHYIVWPPANHHKDTYFIG